MSLKTLPSSIRKKERYIIFKIESEQEYSLGEVVDAIWKELLSFLGERTVAAANPWVMGDLFSTNNQVGGIRVHKGHVEDVRTALALIDHIDREDVCIHILGVSGTIQSARDKYLGALEDE
ncbi:MAG: ribonuclease P protein component 2 [Candidatus Nanohaloarchaeota archaeon QJJ-5]|nr:ribonuclease P protein component 2 [Candidatus Nanohaloarchaeota archaeon QJJ-5]